MIDSAALLRDLQRLRGDLEDDLRDRCDTDPGVARLIHDEWLRAQASGRTGLDEHTWREDHYTQVAVAWILATTFVRFLEDNDLVPEAHLAGADTRLALAKDRRTHHFQQNPTHSDRDYLLAVFTEIAALPGMGALFDRAHNPVWQLGPTGDGAAALVRFWQQIDPDTGTLVHEFTDPNLDTRFLGDLYQDLSEAARKTYALLQTPVFVEEFILDRTLDPAIAEFGYREVRVIDPTCGSGHFLLGAFDRLYEHWVRNEPARLPVEIVQCVLDAIYGVDLNPYATAIAEFRLLVAALRTAGVKRLADAPDFRFNLATGDALLHCPPVGTLDDTQFAADDLGHVYATEDAAELARIFGQRYHAVVGNPPYVTVKDKALNAAYRERYKSCHRQYSLAVPFFERFFDLAIEPPPNASTPSGFVGMITANSFMKREFGKKLVEAFLPRWDLTHVVDTSGAYIPGHGTPTVVVFGRHRQPVADTVRAVMGIRGEPSTPTDPAKGLVWTAICDQIDRPGSEGDYVSVIDLPRERLHSHPWTIGGGGAAELKERLDGRAASRLSHLIKEVGFGAIMGEDDIFATLRGSPRVRYLGSSCQRALVEGEFVRDWSLRPLRVAFFPYDESIALVDLSNGQEKWLWPHRTQLQNRPDFSRRTYREAGRPYWEYHQIPAGRNRTPLSIAFAFVATHNHFVLDRGGKVFNRSAPVIKLPADATEDDHLGLLGLLNSSVACFWGCQTLFPKGGAPEGPWQDRLEWDGTKLQQFPVPSTRPLGRARHLDSLAQRLSQCTPQAVCSAGVPTAEALAEARAEYETILAEMIALQEELDWECYRIYGLVDHDLTAPEDALPRLRLGERAFEIALARRVEAGEADTTWFERHRSTPIIEIPDGWPDAYKDLVRRRIKLIEDDRDIGLIERPEHKRRWNTTPWEDQERDALRTWLLDRLEDAKFWAACQLHSAAQLADRLYRDDDFTAVTRLYTGADAVDLTALVSDLVKAEGVPYLAAWRYTDAGLRKRAVWERTWDLQREEDRTGVSAETPVPPKYTKADFRATDGLDPWRHRGKLDVPKERFIVYPGASRDTDPSPVVGWAGWDHLDQAKALAAYILERKDVDAWSVDRLTPLLAGVLELLPWLHQWHNDLDPAIGMGMGTYFDGFLEGQLTALGLTRDDLTTWRPPTQPRKRGKKAAS